MHIYKYDICIYYSFWCTYNLYFLPFPFSFVFSFSIQRPWSSELAELDHVLQLPRPFLCLSELFSERFGDPETDRNMVPSCCFSAASEVIVVLGMWRPEGSIILYYIYVYI